MNTCEHTTGQLLDFLYGLLDEDELGKLREHLADCASCQAALKHAQEQQRLFSRAARVCEQVKPFAAPDFETPLAEPAPAAASLPTAIQPGLPIQPQANGTRASKRLRPPSWMTYSAMGLAASVLLAIVLGESYSSGLAQREQQVSEARMAVQATEAAFSKAQSTLDEQLKSLPKDLAKDVLHLQVSAPAQYHPQAPSSCTVQTTGLDGEPVAANVVVRVLDKSHKLTLADQEVACDGLQTIQMPAGLAADEAQVVFEVSAKSAISNQQSADSSPWAKVETKLRQVATAPVTHLVTNKTAYRSGDLLFFRTVTLESFSLKPIARALPLRFSLVSLDGNIIKQLPVSQTAAGGIGGGEFALTADIPGGVYYLEVAAADGTGAVLQRRRLEIIRDDTPQVVVDGNRQYHEGDNVPFNLVERSKSVPLAKKAITIQPLDGGRGGGAAGGPMQQTVTDSKGQANFRLPANLNSTRANFQVQEGKNAVVQSVPVIPSKITVDFYPEGGELIDGLPTRLYYRVTSLDGEPIVPRGKIILRSSKGVIYESPSGQAAGVFAFTPSMTESYAVRITDPQFEVVQTDPIESLGVQAKGLTLSIPTGVTRDGEPVRVLLASKGEGVARQVVVMITCRGQIVLHEAVQLGNGQTELKLTPPAGVAGVLRVTAYKAGPEGLLPLAERLVFRMPGQKLELSAASAQGGKLGSFARGQKAQLEIKGVDEQQRPTGYFALAYVLDAKVKTDKDCELPTHFYLAGDVPNDDLEQAHIVLRDDPVSRQALDQFLGAQPWRRVPEAAPALNSQVAQISQYRNQEALKDAAISRQQDRLRTTTAAAPVLVSLENASRSQLRVQYDSRLAKAVSAARGDFLDTKQTLAKNRDAQTAHFHSLASSLDEYRQLPRFYLRQAMSVVVLLCLVLGGLLLFLGAVAILRQQRATAALSGSFAAFGLCMVLYLTARQVSAEIDVSPTVAGLELRPWHHLDPQRPLLALAAAAPKTNSGMLPAGEYSLAQIPEQLARDKSARAVDSEQVAALARRNAEPQPMMAKLTEAVMSNHLSGPGFGGQGYEKQERFAEAKSAQERFAPTPAIAQAPGAGSPPAAVSKSLEKKKDLANNGTDEQKMKADLAAAQGAVAMQNSPYIWPRQGQPDTIAWFPALVTENGIVPLDFPLPNLGATYRVIVHGHSADGRLGYFEGSLEVK